MKRVLALSGLDPTGGAGLIADIRVISARGMFAAGIPTAVTSQTGWTVTAVKPLTLSIFSRSLENLRETHRFEGIKIGMICSPSIGKKIATFLDTFPRVPTVFDPVLASTKGFPLAKGDLSESIIEISRRSTLVTPNEKELRHMGEVLGIRGTLTRVGIRVSGYLHTSLLLTGGHRKTQRGTDILFSGEEVTEIEGTFLRGKDFHGTGCLYSTAILTYLIEGHSLLTSIRRGKSFVEKALSHGFRTEDRRWFWRVE